MWNRPALLTICRIFIMLTVDSEIAGAGAVSYQNHIRFLLGMLNYCKVRIYRFEIAEPVQDGSGVSVKVTYLSHIKPLVCKLLKTWFDFHFHSLHVVSISVVKVTWWWSRYCSWWSWLIIIRIDPGLDCYWPTFGLILTRIDPDPYYNLPRSSLIMIQIFWPSYP